MSKRSNSEKDIFLKNLENLIKENNSEDQLKKEYGQTELHKGRLNMAVDQWTGKTWEQRAIQSDKIIDTGGIAGAGGCIPD